MTNLLKSLPLFMLIACDVGDSVENVDTASPAVEEEAPLIGGDDDSTAEGDGATEEDEQDLDALDIGWEAELRTRSHDVSGTAVIIDEDTIEIRDFTFDGGGVNARLFLVTEGEPFDADIELTDNLVGTPYQSETLTIQLPEGVGFEGWNAITLWCIPFELSFGDGVFSPPVE